MAGRGRGRGRGSMSFSVETLGFGRGESLPAPTVQPPSNFPPLEFKPVSLLTGEEYDYILALKQEFRGAMQESPYYLKFTEKKNDIERYSDKYQLNSQNGDENWEPDWSLLPAELKPTKKRKVKKAVPSIVAKKSQKPDASLLENLQELEKKEQQNEGEQEEDEEGKGSGEEDAIDEDFYDEEEMEEETDYISTYFDNGEGYGMDDEEDGLDDGPVY